MESEKPVGGKFRMAAFLAVAMMIEVTAAFAAVIFVNIPVDNRDYFNILLIALVGWVGTAVGYYLGSSDGSARKTEIAAEKDNPNP